MDYSRCLHGAMKGHSGTIKSVIAELTDETNIARGFSLSLMIWSVGGVIGFVLSSCSLSIFPLIRQILFSSLIGGILSRPQDRWPHIFSHPFWAVYPYFLPCLVAAAFPLVSFVLTAFYLEEVFCFLLFEENSAMMSPRR